jgi:hypothetical protein
MTTNLGQIYANLLFRYGKDFRGGYLSPQTYQYALNTVNQRKMNDLVDVFEKNGEVTSDLQPFIKTLGSPQFPALTFTPVFAGAPERGGYAEIPVDFWYQARANYAKVVNTACTSTSQYAPIALLKQHEFDAVMSDSNDNPTLDSNNYPVMVIQNDLFYVFPYINRCSFTYIMEPPQPIFDYDIISGQVIYLPPGELHTTTNNPFNLPVGSPSVSVEFLYPESCVDSLTDMMKTYVAVGNESEWNIQTQIPDKNA